MISGADGGGTDRLTITNDSATGAVDLYIDSTHHFAITGSTTQDTGSSQTITVTAVGSSGSTFTSYSGDHAVTFSGATSIGAYVPTCSDKTGADIPLGTATTLTFTNGVATCNLKLYKAENAAIDGTDGTYSATGHTLGVTVVPQAVSMQASVSATDVLAGTPVTMTLTAKDAFGNVSTAYTGDKTITFSGAGAVGAYAPTASDKNSSDVSFGSATIINFSGGIATSTLKLYKTGMADVSATDSTFITPALRVTVSPSAAVALDAQAPETIASGVPFDLSLSVRDAYGNGVNLTDDASLVLDHGTVSPSQIAPSAYQSFVGPDGSIYRSENDVLISNSAASDLTDYQVRLTLDTASLITAGKMQADCDDMRFAETDNTNVPYWLESGCNTSSTVVWIKTNLTASASKNVYWYYGNSSVSSVADGSSVFDFFDDFSGSSLDSGKWTVTGTGTMTVSDGIMTARATTSAEYLMKSKTVFGTNYAVRSRLKSGAYGSNSSYEGFLFYGVGGGLQAYYTQNQTNIHKYYSYSGSNNSSANITGFTAGAYGVQDVIRNSTTSVICQVNDANQVTFSTNVYAGTDSSVRFRNTNYGIMYSDWVLVRKYIADEPTAVVGGSSSSIFAAGQHTGSVTIADTGSFTPVNLTATIGSLSDTVSVVVDRMDHFAITGSTTQDTGSSQTITVTAVGSSGSTFTSYSGDHAVTFSGATSIGAYVPTCTDKTGADIPLGTATTLTFNNGVATCNLKLYKAENAAIDGTDGTYSATGHTLGVVVSANATSLAITSASTATAGTPFAVTLTAKDAYGNGATDYNGDKQVTFSGAASIGAYAPTCTDKNGTDVAFGAPATLAFSNGTAACQMKLYRKETVNMQAGDGTYTATKTVIVSAAALSSFDASAPAIVPNDTSFPMTVTARDIYGNTASDFADPTSVNISRGAISPDSIVASAFRKFTDAQSNQYDFKKDVTITNNVASNLVGYQTKVVFDTAALIAAGRMQGDCDDLRFAETNGTAIPYWMESGCNTSSTVVWIKTDLTASASKTVYMYYGNSGVSSSSSAKNVFNVGDDFNDGTMDSGWTYEEGRSTNSYTESDGAIRLVFAINSYAHIQQAGLPANFIAETKVKRGITANDFSWAPGIGVWFNALDNAQIMLGSNTYFIGNRVINGTATSSTSGAFAFGTYYYLRMVVSSTNYYFYMSSDNANWTLIYSAARPASWTIDVNSLVLLGTGYEASGYGNADLDNNYSSIGADADAYFDWMRVRQYVATEPTVSVQSDAALAGTYADNFTISGVTTAGNATITLANGAVSRTVDIYIDSLDHFVISGSATQAAGTSQTITLTAVGVSGQAYGTYAGDKSVVFSGAASINGHVPTCTDKNGNAVPLGTATDLTFTNGAAECNLVLYKAETAAVNANDGIINATGHELSVAVTSTASAFALSVPAATAGIPASVTLIAQDTYGNPATDYTGNHDIFFTGASAQGAYVPTVSDRNGSDIQFGAANAVSLVFDSGVAATTFKLYKAELANMTATDNTYSATASVQVDAGPLSSFDVAVPVSTRSGVPFELTLDAQDSFGNLTTNITDTTTVSVSAGTINGGTIPASQFQAFVAPDTQVYTYKKNVTISNSVATAVTGYQMELTIDTAALISAGKLQSDCDDLRFSEENGANIPYYLEGGCNTASTSVWVKTSVPSRASKSIYMYYGNGNVTSESSGGDVFDFFSDFEEVTTGQLGTWTAQVSGPSVHHEYAVSDPITGSKAMETYAEGGWTGTIFTTRTATLSAGDYVVDLGLYTNYGHAYDSNMRARVQANSSLIYDGLPTTGDIWEERSFNLIGSGAVNSLSFGQWGNWFSANPSMRYDDIHIRRYLSSVPTFTMGAENVGGTRSFNVTISGILQDTDVDLTVTNGSVVSSASVLVQAADHMNHFAVTGSAIQTAGASQEITITAIGESGDPYVLYSGDHIMTLGGATSIGAFNPSATDKSGADVVLGSATTLEFTNGVAHTDLKLFKDENVSITATDGTYNSLTGELAIDVAPAALASFDLSMPANATSESSFSVTVGLKDAYGNTVMDIPSPVVLAVNHGAVSPNSIAVSEFSGDGTYTGNLTISQIYVNTNTSLTFSCGAVSASRTVTVTGVDHMDHWILDAANQIAGATQTVTITAVGLSGNTYMSYAGDKSVTFSGADTIGSNSPMANGIAFGSATTLAFSNGSATAPMQLFKTGSVSIAVSGEYSATRDIVVSPAPVASFDLTAPDTAVTNSSFSMTLTARDQYGNISTNVSSNVSLGVSSGAISPSPISHNYFNDDGVYGGNFTISQVYATTSVTVTFTCGNVTRQHILTVSGVNNMHHFSLSGSATQTAGDTQTMTITAILDSGQTDATYTGSHNLIFSGPSSINGNIPTVDGINFGTSTPVTFVAGVAQIQVRLYRAGSVSISGNDGTYSITGFTVNVTPLAAASFVFGNPTGVVSGVPFSLSLTAKDIYGNTTTTVTDNLTVSADAGTLSPTSILASTFATNGTSATSFAIGDILADTDVTLTFTSGSITATKIIAVTGVDETHHFTISGNGTQVAGENQTITVTAIAVSGNTDIDYTGSHSVVFSGGQTISGNVPTVDDIAFGSAVSLDFQNGVATADLRLFKASNQTINLSCEGFNATGHTLVVGVVPAAVSTFSITSPSTAVSGTAFAATLTAKDAFTNTTTNVTNDIALSVDHGSIGPASIALANFQSTGAYSASLSVGDITEGMQQVTITFTSGLVIQTKSINIYPVDQMSSLYISGASSQTAGDVQTITIIAKGVSGQTYAAYTGEKSVTFSGPSAIGSFSPSVNSAAMDTPLILNFHNGVASATLHLFKTEAAGLTITDGTYSSGALTVNVIPAPVAALTLTADAAATSGSLFSLAISAFDSYGNISTIVDNPVALAVSSGTISPSSVAASEFTDDGLYATQATVSGVLSDRTVTVTATTGLVTGSTAVSMTGVDVMDHFTVTGTSTQIAGSSQQITITAIGQSGNVFTGYTGNHNLVLGGSDTIGLYIPSATDKDGAVVLFGSPTTLAFNAGVATTSITLYEVSASDISVTDSSYGSSGHNLSVAVSPSVLYSFAGGVPTVATSGQPFILTLQAKDLYGNNVTDVAGTTALSVNAGQVSPASITADQFMGGAFLSDIAIEDIFADTPVTLTVTNGAVVQTASLTVTGVDLVHHIRLTSNAASLIAGHTIPVTISLMKEDDSVYTDYAGLKSIILSGAEGIGINAPYFTDKDMAHTAFGISGVFSFVNGVATTQVTLYKSGNISLGASDGYHDAGSGLALAVNPAGLDSLELGAPASAISGQSFALNITAKDQYGNNTSDVDDPVTLSASAGTLDTSSVPAAGFATDGTYIANITVSGLATDQSVDITAGCGVVFRSVPVSFTVPVSSGGGVVFIPPKPDVTYTKIILLASDRLGVINIPSDASQFAISPTPDFEDASFWDISDLDNLLNQLLSSSHIYLKFRTSQGGVSDVVSYSQSVISTPDLLLLDGDIVKTESSFDVYIVKFNNGKQYRRLILSPSVFDSYRHLKWENLKIISDTQLNKFAVSDLVQVAGDPNIYQLAPDGDTGKRWVFNKNSFYDRDSVYEINCTDRDSYALIDSPVFRGVSHRTYGLLARFRQDFRPNS